MLSLSTPPPPCGSATGINSLNLKSLSHFTSNISLASSKFNNHRIHCLKPKLGIILPNQQPQKQLYQPFQPPPSPLPEQYTNLDIPGRIELLSNRLGLWYEYAPLISSLLREGFTPSNIEESTGISGVEQNRFIVAAQVRESLVQSNITPQLLSFFDNGGSELLYEIRLLSISQRASAARFIVDNNLDGKGAQELARAIKDFPSRRGEKGWESFDYTLPGDCYAFLYYRQAREHNNASDEWTSFLEEALRVAETDKARKTILKELKEDDVAAVEEEDIISKVVVPVVRLKIGEVAEANKVIVLPVCKAQEGEKSILEAPFEMRSEGDFGVVVAEKAWERWVALPGWEPLVVLGKGGVVVSFGDARMLPWKVNRWYKEEPILVVIDRSKREVDADDGFYLVKVDEGDMKVERGSTLKQIGFSECLGNVVLVVRPPREEDDDGQLSDVDWD